MGSVKNELPFDWVMGVTDETIKEGVILEEGYVKGGGLPKFYSGDIDVTFSEDDQPVMNILILEGLLRNTSGNLTFKIYESTGNDTYPILKSGGILQVARTLPSTITEVVTTSSFKIPPQDYLVLERHDARFTENNRGGKFACRIKSNDQLYNANFTISGGTLSLTNISNGDPFPIASLAVGDSFQLTNCFDILEEGLDKNGSTGYPVRGYVIKHDEPANSWVKFNKYDKPNKTTKDAVIVGFYELEDLKRDFLYFEQIDKHGPVTQKEKLDYPITEAELDLIVKNFRKYLEPYRTFKLVTRRPSILQKGTEVFFNLSRYPSGFYKVISNSIDYNHSEGELDGIPFRTQEITFANYENNFAKTIAKLRRKNELEKAKTAENSQERDTQTLILNYTWSPEEEEEITVTIPDAPTGLTIDSYTNTTAEISWNTVATATSYKLYIYDAGTPISGYNGKVITGITESVTGLTETKTYTVKVKASNSAGDSGFSTEESFTTSGEYLIYRKNNGIRIYIYKNNLAMTNEQRLTSQTSFPEADACVSKDGKYILFNRDTIGGAYQIFLWDVIAGTERQMSNNSGRNYRYLGISTDGYIFYTRGTALYKNLLSSTTANFDSNETILLSGLAFQPGSISVSKDNTFLVIAGNNIIIKVIIATGSSSTLIATNLNYSYPVISQDGTKITYIKNFSGTYDLAIANIDCSGELRLTNNGSIEYFSALTYDNLKVYYQEGNDIRRVNSDGTGDSLVASGISGLALYGVNLLG